jgi:lipoyl-dependent peroxiredoxin
MAAERRASAVWEGNLLEGKGTILDVGSGAFGNLPVTWAARTESSDGKTSPEELIAAAHAACFSMAFSSDLTKAGFPPERINVSAVCTFDKIDDKWSVKSVDLDATARVPEIDRNTFQRVAEGARVGCPVSRALANNVDIRLNARLEQ